MKFWSGCSKRPAPGGATSDMRETPLAIDYGGALGRQIIELHVWAVRQGLLGVHAAELFDGFCQRLVSAQVPLWRASAAMRTLHPQMGWLQLHLATRPQWD